MNHDTQIIMPPQASNSVTQVQDTLPDLSKLPLWQQRYIAAIQGGLSTQEATRRANVTAATISDWTSPSGRRYDPVFAHAEALVASGAAIAGNAVSRSLAAAVLPSLVEDAVAESRDPANRAGDRLGNRRWVSEVADALPRAQGTQVAVQINVIPGTVAPVTPDADSGY